MRNTRPADLKKMIQGLIILTLLCWATQTLVSQWGFGDEVEKFVAPVAIALATTRPIIAESNTRLLRDLLIAEVAERFGLPVDSLQVRFSQEDEKVLSLADSTCKFDIVPRKQRNIGDITWDVTITSDKGRQKYSVSANVRAWQSQVIAVRPIANRQVIGESDVTEKRVLVDHL